MSDQSLDTYIWITGTQSSSQRGAHLKMADFECTLRLIHGLLFIQSLQRPVNDGVQDIYKKESVILPLLSSSSIILSINIHKTQV